ncbi:MAG TPA: hypothetical protein VK886_10580 [Vicinamibacterales bacterium]|nr:hypothetical protein [Vicinamibacterales bacterium]
MRVWLAFLVLGLGAAGILTGQGRVPSEYETLYSELSSHLDRFSATIKSGASRPLFAAELLPANGNRGEALLVEQTFPGTVLYLDRLQKMGLQGVTIQMPYPLLAPGYPRSEEYWKYYRRVAAEVRRRGLKLLAKSGLVFTEKEISPVMPDYSRVSWDEYLAARSQIAARIAAEIAPDYLTFLNEPSTEAMVLGKPAQPASRYRAFVRDTLGRIRTRGGSSRTLLGAGAGTWDNVEFIRTLAATRLDYIDLHVYPLASRGADFLERAREMARIARRARKRVVIGEFWLYKAAARELTGAPVHVEMFGRDTFGFWSPLDARMFETVAAFASAEGVDYVSAFWSKYFFASLDYERLGSYPPGSLLRESDRQAAQNILANVLSDTGRAYQRVATAR